MSPSKAHCDGKCGHTSRVYSCVGLLNFSTLLFKSTAQIGTISRSIRLEYSPECTRSTSQSASPNKALNWSFRSQISFSWATFLVPLGYGPSLKQRKTHPGSIFFLQSVHQCRHFYLKRFRTPQENFSNTFPGNMFFQATFLKKRRNADLESYRETNIKKMDGIYSVFLTVEWTTYKGGGEEEKESEVTVNTKLILKGTMTGVDSSHMRRWGCFSFWPVLKKC